ncbi:MAG: hypothetical protein IJ604_08355 [Prevotella sp.]|nr:hypothetical protein [Prevotella sp.]MBR1463362.1 hypothetical protein [Prevotella sp.]
MNSSAVFDATFMQNLSLIAQDENLARRLVRYVSKLAHPKEDETRMTEQEFFNNIEEAEKQIERGEGITFNSIEDMNLWLSRL